MAQVIFNIGKAGVVSRLSWAPLTETGAKQRAAAIRKRARDEDANRFVEVQLEGRSAFGVGTPEALDESKLPSTVHSLACLVAKYAAAAAANAGDSDGGNLVFAWRIESRIGGGATDVVREMYAVVVIDEGLPVHDDVKSVTEAQSQVASFMGDTRASYRLVSNDLAAFPNGLAELSQQELESFAGKDTLLLSPPVDKLRVTAGILAAAVLLGGGYWHQQIYKPAKEREERIRAAAAADPVPKYLADQELQIGQMGVARPAMLALIARLERYPVWVAGWALNDIYCAAEACTATWTRVGGRTNELLAARPGEELLDGSTQDRALLRFPAEMPLSGLMTREEAVHQAAAVAAATPVLQDWDNAGLKVGGQAVGYAVWPAGSGYDTKGLPPDVTMRARAIEVSAPYALAAEVITAAPSDYWWNSLHLKVDPSDKAQAVSATLKGVSYVR